MGDRRLEPGVAERVLIEEPHRAARRELDAAGEIAAGRWIGERHGGHSQPSAAAALLKLDQSGLRLVGVEQRVVCRPNATPHGYRVAGTRRAAWQVDREAIGIEPGFTCPGRVRAASA